MPWIDGRGREELDLLAALDVVASGVIVYDLDGCCVFLNRAAVRGFEEGGIEDPLDFFSGGTWAELFPEASGGTFERAFTAVVDGRVRESRVDVHYPPDTVWDCHLERLEDRVVVTFRDVTDVRELAEDFNRLVARYPFGGIMVFDRALEYRQAGGRGFDEIDVDPADMVGRTPREVWPPDIADRLEEHFRRALDGVESEDRIGYGGREYLCWAAPLPEPGGEIERGVLVTWEITETVRAEEDFRLVRQAVESLDLGVTIADARAEDHPLVFVSAGFARLTGYPREEALGSNCRFLQGEDTDPETVATIRRALEAGETCQVTLKNYRKDGSSFWNRLSIFPMRDEQDRLTHFLGVQEDVSEQRSMGLQLKQSERLSALGRLAGGVAHDIRNILTGAGGLLELALDRDELPDEVVQDLAEAREVLRRGASVTSRLLTFSRGGIVKEETVDLNELVEERVDFLRSVLRDDVQVTWEVCERPAWVHIDPGQIDQVLMNLANNAEDAMPDGGELNIRVACGPLPAGAGLPATVDPESPWVLLSVRDSGQGMDPDTVEKAFDPFFTTKEQGEGTGLGLPSVYGAVTGAGGECWIDSEPGRGTTVNMLLPEAPPRAEGGEEDDDQMMDGAGRTVLVVEDEPAVRSVCVRALEKVGFRAVVAPDGQAGLEAFRERSGDIALLITDAVMPSLSGIELARTVHADRPDIAIIVISGHTEESLDGLDPDRVHFLAKPFALDGLLDAVRTALGS